MVACLHPIFSVLFSVVSVVLRLGSAEAEAEAEAEGMLLRGGACSSRWGRGVELDVPGGIEMTS